MTPAFLWRMVHGEDIAYLVWSSHIVAEIDVPDGVWAGVVVESHENLSVARDYALRRTEYMETIGYQLNVIYAHPNPVDVHIPSMILRLHAYHKAGDFHKVRVVCGDVMRAFYTAGEMLHGPY